MCLVPLHVSGRPRVLAASLDLSSTGLIDRRQSGALVGGRDYYLGPSKTPARGLGAVEIMTVDLDLAGFALGHRFLAVEP